MARHVRPTDCMTLSAVGLSDKAEKRPCELSGGQRQRVALARTYSKIGLLFCLTNLFPHSMHVLSDMQDLAVCQLIGRTVLLVTHDPGEAVRLAIVFTCFKTIA